MSWWAIYWAIHSHIHLKWYTRFKFRSLGPQIWGHLLTKHHIWRIETKKKKNIIHRPYNLKRCTRLFGQHPTTGEPIYLGSSILRKYQLRVVHGFKFRPQVPKSWGQPVRKYHIWRISEDYPAKTKRCTTFVDDMSWWAIYWAIHSYIA